ncbi:MAG: hypothetical protein AAB116_04690 [Candidatus Poribacteria bacterium]
MGIERKIKQRLEYRVKLEKDQLDYSKILNDEDLKDELVCPKCQNEKEFVISPYWGFGRIFHTCYFVCPKCEERR